MVGVGMNVLTSCELSLSPFTLWHYWKVFLKLSICQSEIIVHLVANERKNHEYW